MRLCEAIVRKSFSAGVAVAPATLVAHSHLRRLLTRTNNKSIPNNIRHGRALLCPRLTQNRIIQLARRPYFLAQCNRDDAK
jgi:hypothetical protein